MMYPFPPQLDDADLPGRQEAGLLPRSWLGLLLALPYVLLVIIQVVDDLRCSGMLCGIKSITLTAPTSLLAFVVGQLGIWIGLAINTLVLYLLGAGLQGLIENVDSNER